MTTTAHPVRTPRTTAAPESARTPGRFARWFRSRPAIGGLLAVLGGLELFFSGQLDVGRIHISIGIEGLQATVIPLAIVLLGVLATAMPQHRIFYGVILLALALYSLVGVNLGGFVIGMLLSAVGGILIVAWMPRVRASATAPGGAQSGASPSGVESGAGVAGGTTSAPRSVATGSVAPRSATAGRTLPEYVAAVTTAAAFAELVAARSGTDAAGASGGATAS